MDFVLVPDAEAPIAEAVRTSAAREGVGFTPARSASVAWWRAGVLDATQRGSRSTGPAPAAPRPRAAGYDAAPPRRTRGATRA
jgi:hypothetical protein